jgi:hypothetical protein
MIVLLLLMGSTWGVMAQKSGEDTKPKPVGQTPPALPQSVEDWLRLSDSEFFAALQAPGGLSVFFNQVVPEFLTREWEGSRFSAFGDELTTALESPIVRIVAALLGFLLLSFPHRLYWASWLFIGMVAGAVVVQTSLANEVLMAVFPNEEILRISVVGIVVAFGLTAVSVGFTLGFFTFFAVVLAGGVAGALLAANAFNGGYVDLSNPIVTAPAVILGVLMAVALGRGQRLLAAFVGGGLLAFSLGIAPVFGVMLGVISVVVMVMRTRYRGALRRQPLASLELSEGQVNLEGQKRTHRTGTPQSPVKMMRDSSDDSPIGGF